MKFPASGTACFDYRSQGIRFGDDVLSTLPVDLRAAGFSRSAKILVTGGNASLRESGVLQNLERVLGGYAIKIADGIPHTPTKASADGLTEFLRQYVPDCIIAVGGGSVLDTTKIAKLWAGSAAPLFAVPTTAGTGAETTPFATLWDYANGVKHSVESSDLLPSLVYLDPRFTHSMPKVQTAATAIDSLSHALESLWSMERNRESSALALESATATLSILDDLTRAAPAAASRRRQAWAALLAGFSIGISKTALAHAVSYGFTLFHQVPHGLAIGVVLPEIARFNWSALEPAERSALLAASGQTDIDQLADRLHSLATASAFAFPPARTWRIDDIAAQAADSPRALNNRVSAGRAAITGLLEQAAARWKKHDARANVISDFYPVAPNFE